MHELLIQQGPLTSAEAAAFLGCSQSAASSAGRVLVTDGRAKQERHGGRFEAIPLTEEQKKERAAWAEAAAIAAKTLTEPQAPKAKPRPEPEERGHHVDIARISEAAALFAPGPFGFLLWVDARCVSAGRPPLSPWWRSPYALRGFYESGKRWGIFCVGRGGGKSTSLEEVAATESLFAPRSVPPGQIWTWPFISTNPGDASRRLRGIEAIYRAIGLQFVGEIGPSGTKVTEGIRVSYASPANMMLLDARGNPIQLLSIAGTIGNVSGPSTIGGTIDEAAKLLDKTEHANPLHEVFASLTQTFRARPGIRAICCSSAFDRAGLHFKMVEAGTTETNFVAHIGKDFLDDALRGFEQVAQWEQHHKKDPRAAAQVRTHAASLSAASPFVPTWVANPTLGNPSAQPWDGAALASRIELEAIPEGSDKLEGFTRTTLWLRECGSLAIDRAGGFDPRSQLVGLADANAELARRIGRGAPHAPGPQPHPLAPPGDPRYAGPRFGDVEQRRRYLF